MYEKEKSVTFIVTCTLILIGYIHPANKWLVWSSIVTVGCGSSKLWNV